MMSMIPAVCMRVSIQVSPPLSRWLLPYREVGCRRGRGGKGREDLHINELLRWANGPPVHRLKQHTPFAHTPDARRPDSLQTASQGRAHDPRTRARPPRPPCIVQPSPESGPELYAFTPSFVSSIMC